MDLLDKRTLDKIAKKLAELSEHFLEVNMELGAVDGAVLGGLGLAPGYVTRPEIAAALKANSFKFAQSVSKTAARRLKASLVQGLARGEETNLLKQRIIGVFTDSKAKAELIARTESARAYTRGFRNTADSTGVISGYQWEANADACEFCLDVEGSIVKSDQNFFELDDSLTVDGATLNFDYDLIDGPPLHPNCRCSLIAIIADLQRTIADPTLFQQ